MYVSPRGGTGEDPPRGRIPRQGKRETRKSAESEKAMKTKTNKTHGRNATINKTLEKKIADALDAIEGYAVTHRYGKAKTIARRMRRNVAKIDPSIRTKRMARMANNVANDAIDLCEFCDGAYGLKKHIRPLERVMNMSLDLADDIYFS